jgi:hypothetical protein
VTLATTDASSGTLTAATLDEILAWQMLVAFAGETPGGGTPRLGWWRTDLGDSDGGGDFLQRLLPRTHAWAGLRAMREAARRTELRVVHVLGGTLRVRTLFWLDPAVDEALEERVAQHMFQVPKDPREALPWPCAMDPWKRDDFEAAVRAMGDGAHTLAPNGRELKGAVPSDRAAAFRALIPVLLPLRETYPMPFYRV